MRGSGVPNTRIFAIFLLFRVDFCISKNPLNTKEPLRLTTTFANPTIQGDTFAAITYVTPMTYHLNGYSTDFCYIASKWEMSIPALKKGLGSSMRVNVALSPGGAAT
jgi:hypothetical protein